jgi:hypothetical protein
MEILRDDLCKIRNKKKMMKMDCGASRGEINTVCLCERCRVCPVPFRR